MGGPMRILWICSIALIIAACGKAEFSSDGASQKASNDANGVVSQDVIDMCAAAGQVPKASDSCSDDDSTSVDSVDDDSVDGVSADNSSSDDDSSDDKACAVLADCIKKKCEPAAPAPNP